MAAVEFDSAARRNAATLMELAFAEDLGGVDDPDGRVDHPGQRPGCRAIRRAEGRADCVGALVLQMARSGSDSPRFFRLLVQDGGAAFAPAMPSPTSLARCGPCSLWNEPPELRATAEWDRDPDSPVRGQLHTSALILDIRKTVARAGRPWRNTRSAAAGSQPSHRAL